MSLKDRIKKIERRLTVENNTEITPEDKEIAIKRFSKLLSMMYEQDVFNKIPELTGFNPEQVIDKFLTPPDGQRLFYQALKLLR